LHAGARVSGPEGNHLDYLAPRRKLFPAGGNIGPRVAPL